MDLFHSWLSQKPKYRRHASFIYSFLSESNLWMCTLVVHDDQYVYSFTAKTVSFRGTAKNTKQTSKKLAVCAFLNNLQEYDEYDGQAVDEYSDHDSDRSKSRPKRYFDMNRGHRTSHDLDDELNNYFERAPCCECCCGHFPSSYPEEESDIEIVNFLE